MKMVVIDFAFGAVTRMKIIRDLFDRADLNIGREKGVDRFVESREWDGIIDGVMCCLSKSMHACICSSGASKIDGMTTNCLQSILHYRLNALSVFLYLPSGI